MPMKHRFTPSLIAKIRQKVHPHGPSVETICMLQMFARCYNPQLEERWLDKHLLT